MNPPDLKKGQAYLILADYHGKDSDGDCVFIAESTERRLFLPFVAVQNCVFLPSEPPTLVGSSPKYDPCRKFRKGDIVRAVRRNGRESTSSSVIEDLYEETLTVVGGEDSDNDVLVDTSKGNRFIQFYFLELVTPVEALEPYSMVDAHTHWDVADKDMKTVATYSKSYHPHAKEAAEAECARLNAEYRKEQA